MKSNDEGMKIAVLVLWTADFRMSGSIWFYNIKDQKAR